MSTWIQQTAFSEFRQSHHWKTSSIASNNVLPTATRVTRYLTCKRCEVPADAEPGTWFVERLATYCYLNMDQVVGQTLATYRQIEEALAKRCMDGVVLGGQV